MAMGKSFNKSILFVLGIVLVVSAFSGCTDAPSAPAYEQAVTDTPAATNAPTAINAPAVINEPTNTENSDIQSSGAELYKELLAQDDPEAFKQLIGMNINDLKIKGLGTPTISGEVQLRWYNGDIEPAGLIDYAELYNGGLMYGLYFRKNDNNFFQVSAGNDGKINEVNGGTNRGRFLINDRWNTVD